VIGAPSIDQSSFISMDVFKNLERPQNQQPQILVQSGVDQTSYISQPDRFAVFDQVQPNRRPLNDFGGVDETPLVSMEKIRLLEIPSKAARQPYDVEEKQQAPTVISPLQPIEAQEGSPVVLTAKIDGSPMPNVSRNDECFRFLSGIVGHVSQIYVDKRRLPMFALKGHYRQYERSLR
jgi:hypothetical protein